MRMYSVGPDDLYDREFDYKWIVYWYEVEDYDGRGEAISWDGEHLRAHDLGHCSCYGPEEGLGNREGIITADNFESDNVLDKRYRSEIVRKVKELLEGEQEQKAIKNNPIRGE